MFWKSPQILRDPLFFFYYIQFDVSKTLYLGNDGMVLYLQVVDPVCSQLDSTKCRPQTVVFKVKRGPYLHCGNDGLQQSAFCIL